LAFPEDHHLDIVLAEHTAIVDGLKGGDAKAMSGHLNRVFKTIRHLLSQRSEFFAPNSRAALDQSERIYG
jgi:GntR family transcriptional regulator, rspAB operon transcriptional repressor